MQKGLAPILIILFIAAVVGIGGYFVYRNNQPKAEPTQITQPSPTTESTSIDETANWKEYKDKEFKFSFKYPPEISVDETFRWEDAISISVGDLLIEVLTKDFDKGQHVGISRGELERALYNAQLNQEYKDAEIKRRFIKIDTKDIDSISFTVFLVEGVSDAVPLPDQPKHFSKGIVGIVGNNLYSFLPGKEPLTNQILSTFKFTQ